MYGFLAITFYRSKKLEFLSELSTLVFGKNVNLIPLAVIEKQSLDGQTAGQQSDPKRDLFVFYIRKVFSFCFFSKTKRTVLKMKKTKKIM